MLITIVVAVIMYIIYSKFAVPTLKEQNKLNARNIIPGVCLLIVLLVCIMFFDYGFTHGNATFFYAGAGGWAFTLLSAIILSHFILPKFKKKIILRKGAKTTGHVEKFIFSSSTASSNGYLKKKYNIMVNYTDKNNILKTAISVVAYDMTVLSFFTSLDHLELLVDGDSCLILNEVPKGYYDDKFNVDVELVEMPHTVEEAFKPNKDEN